jgi:hypothetical protein
MLDKGKDEEAKNIFSFDAVMSVFILHNIPLMRYGVCFIIA